MPAFFDEFEFQILEKRNYRDRASINGVFIEQMESASKELSDYGLSTREVLKVLYELNFRKLTPECVIDDGILMLHSIKETCIFDEADVLLAQAYDE